MLSQSKDINLQPACAVCNCTNWALTQATDRFRELFPEATPGSPLLPVLERKGLVAPGQLSSVEDTGSLVCPVQDKTLTFLRWMTVRLEFLVPFRILDVLQLPLDMFEERELLYSSLTNILDSIHDGIWMIDSRGITIAVNKAMQRIAGITARDVVGISVLEAAKLKKFSSCVTLRALEEKRTVTMFDDYANGRHCLNTATPVFDDQGNVVRVIAIIRDLSELESMNDTLEGMAASTRPAYNETEMLQLGILGGSSASQQLRASLMMAAQTDAPVLLQGETGTGKTMSAKAIHNLSQRKDMNFVSLNCASIPLSLLESELFGYESGAFTGASRKGRKSVFELADKGTLFLDEIAELPLSAQATLLHVLDGDPFRRVGGTTDITTNVRILAATNKDLEKMVEGGSFRKDLFFRLRVIAIDIPAVRERPEDIPGLIEYFLTSMGKGQTVPHLNSSLRSSLRAYTWPGNIREIRSVARYFLALGKKRLTTDDLPPYIRSVLPRGATARRVSRQSLQEQVEALEKDLISRALRETGSTYKAARLLKVSQSTIVRKAHRYHLGEYGTASSR
ncbi:hypothetical protein B5F76_07135 [Desulfovibrio sp. An276]|uniref:sigma-54 interaction domain-containing protein n=1 Tax=Desulfovibrio sp. An276 TaxID=1965618 RepID=UPI000B3A7F63|nr:sigma 54-interacting transcriptional regulator [Desulfovibrio sp. An276]OUO52691.1 hypothetical protein B5F76_07135 [Desulfovibrio sp. An276]